MLSCITSLAKNGGIDCCITIDSVVLEDIHLTQLYTHMQNIRSNAVPEVVISPFNLLKLARLMLVYSA